MIKRNKTTKLITIVGLLALAIIIYSFLNSRSSIPYFFKKDDTYGIVILEKHISSSITKNLEVDLRYPQIKYNDNTPIQDKVNDLILSVYDEWYLNLEDIDESEWLGVINGNYNVPYKIGNLLGIRLVVYWYGTGAAHGNTSIRTLNINLNNGEVFEFKDLFRSWARKEMDNLIMQRLKEHKCYWGVFEPNNISTRDNQHFYFESNRLITVFNKYEIACGACGPIEVAVPFSELHPFVNPDGPLQFLTE